MHLTVSTGSERVDNISATFCNIEPGVPECEFDTPVWNASHASCKTDHVFRSSAFRLVTQSCHGIINNYMSNAYMIELGPSNVSIQPQRDDIPVHSVPVAGRATGLQ